MAQVSVGIVLGLVAAGCGTAARSGPKAIKATTTTTTTVAPTSTTVSPTQQVVADWEAARNAATQASVALNPRLPALIATATGGELDQIQALITVEASQHDTIRGNTGLGTPTVVSYSANKAMVHSCLDDNLISYGPNGLPLPSSAGQHSFDDVTDVMVPGPIHWMWAGDTETGVPSCPA